MFNKVTIDLLFNLLLIFVCLFFLAFVQVNEPTKDKNDAQNDNNILITMRWETNNDMDLWLKLPEGGHVGYSNRDVPPAHLDVDVVAWRRYTRGGYNPDMSHGEGYDYDEYGEYGHEHEQQPEEYIIKNNEEIITIRHIMAGEYVVNVHYFSDRGYGRKPIKVEIMVQDVRNKRILYSGNKRISTPRSETHFVKFTVVDKGDNQYSVEKVYDDRPTYFVGKKK